MHNIHFVFDSILIGSLLIETIAFIKIRKPCGTLLIDSHQDKDLYRFDIDDIDSLSKKKYIVIKVNPNAVIRENNK